jgi:hypothetical protein
MIMHITFKFAKMDRRTEDQHHSSSTIFTRFNFLHFFNTVRRILWDYQTKYHHRLLITEKVKWVYWRTSKIFWMAVNAFYESTYFVNFIFSLFGFRSSIIYYHHNHTLMFLPGWMFYGKSIHLYPAISVYSFILSFVDLSPQWSLFFKLSKEFYLSCREHVYAVVSLWRWLSSGMLHCVVW